MAIRDPYPTGFRLDEGGNIHPPDYAVVGTVRVWPRWLTQGAIVRAAQAIHDCDCSCDREPTERHLLMAEEALRSLLLEGNDGEVER